METSQLRSAEFWESDFVELRLNPRRKIDAEGLLGFLTDEIGIRKSVVMATSGSSGIPKFAVLSKEALLHSARAVSAHSGISAEDVSLAALSDFHVGGLGIFARSYVTGHRVVSPLDMSWKKDGSTWLPTLAKENVSLVSMTPTHLHDLVRHGIAAPDSVRIVFLGGGRMDADVIAAARNLGWPIRASYGMTEASSQVATAVDSEIDRLPILPIWDTRIGDDGKLALRGPALFSGYATKSGNAWSFSPSEDSDGWWVTGDRCALEGNQLRFLGRADDLVKVSGELVSLARIDARVAIAARKSGVDAAVVVLPDGRRENRFVVVAERADLDERDFLDRINEDLDGIEEVRSCRFVDELPRTEIGKIDRLALEKLAGKGCE